MNLISISQRLSYFLLVSIYSCNGSDIGDTSGTAKNISQHYSVVYQEGNGNLQVYAQFRIGNDKGPSIALNSPGNIQFDDALLNADSSNRKEIIYHQLLSVENVYGEHHFTFTGMDNKKYDNKFLFDDFKINLPLTIHKDQPLNVEFATSPLQKFDYIQISPLESDSSFSVTYSGADTTKCIVIPPANLQKQRTGQLKLAVTLYRRMPLKKSTPGGGYIEIMYTLDPVYISLLD